MLIVDERIHHSTVIIVEINVHHIEDEVMEKNGGDVIPETTEDIVKTNVPIIPMKDRTSSEDEVRKSEVVEAMLREEQKQRAHNNLHFDNRPKN